MTETYWDKLARTPEEKDLLKRLRCTKFGRVTEELYATKGCEGYWEEGDTFASEVIYRVGYEIGHWYQDYEYEPSRGYPDGLTPAMVKSAERWVRRAEEVLKTGRQVYW